MGAVPRGYPRYVLAVMVGINFLNYVDRWIFPAAAEVVKKEFGLSDADIGFIASSFLVVYAVAALPFGIWADRGVRRTIIGIGVSAWSLATLLTGFSRNFGHLVLSRAAVGVGEAGYYPAGTSMLGDYFPKATRSRAMAIWGAGSAVGIAVGFAGGGLITSHFGWRTAFFVTAIPGLIFAVLAFTVREPLRGAAEARGPSLASAHHANLGSYLQLLRIPTLTFTILSQTALFFVLAANAVWLPTVLQRVYGMPTGKAGTTAGGVIVAGGLIGTLAGGWMADRRNLTTPRGSLEVGIAGFLIGAVCVTAGLLAPSFTVFLPAFFVGVVALYLYSGPFTAISQNVVVPSLRASAVTLTLLIAHLVGDSHAPFDVGLLSDRLGNLRTALLIVSPIGLLIAAGFAALALRTIDRDIKSMEATWERAEPEVLLEPA
jgi:MFS family permease